MRSVINKTKEFIHNSKVSFKYSFLIARKEIVLTIILISVSAVMPYLTAFFLGKLINTLTSALGAIPNFTREILWVFFSYAFVNSLPNLLSAVQSFYKRIWDSKYDIEMEIMTLRKKSEIDIAYYEDSKFQDFMQRTFRRNHWPILELTDNQIEIFRGIIGLIIGLVLAAQFDPMIYLILIACSIPKFIVEYKFSHGMWYLWNEDSPETRRYNSLRGYFWRQNVSEIKLSQSVEYILSWIHRIMSIINKKQIRLEKNRVGSTVATEFVALGGFVGAAYLILQSVISGNILVGSMVFLLSTLSNIQFSISNILINIARQNEKYLMVKDIIKFMETEPIIKIPSNPIKLNLLSPPTISFEKVSFKYQNSENYSLKNLNLTLEPGKKIGLVGNNGAGKTTFIKLICRIYDPTEGRILINGVDLKDLDLKEWWSYIGVMFQDFMSYEFITKEAIAVGRADAPLDMNQVLRAGQISQSDAFIQEWKRKYDEPIGVEFDGVEPSKGQRQKLAIARTIYRNPYVMILDEPTASVDAESEAKIFDSIDNLPNSMTALLISHDFSTIRECDNIFVFDHGELKESGDHDKLMKEKGLYAELFSLQAKRFK